MLDNKFSVGATVSVTRYSCGECKELFEDFELLSFLGNVYGGQGGVIIGNNFPESALEGKKFLLSEVRQSCYCFDCALGIIEEAQVNAQRPGVDEDQHEDG